MWDVGDNSSVYGLPSTCVAVTGKEAKVRGLTGGIILPFINYSKVNRKEIALKKQALSRQLVSIYLKIPVGNN